LATEEKSDFTGDVTTYCGLEGPDGEVRRTTIMDRAICFLASRLEIYSNAAVRGAGRLCELRRDWPASRGPEI
jgi:hypothetical protein